MPADVFHFKQFSVWQDRCAMKVTTDACVFGAWLPVPDGPCRVLDIGAGTGLLSLMVAQRCPEAVIDAVELDEAAARQAGENVAASPFAARIRVIAGDVRTALLADAYDLIVSNPPFFTGALRNPDARKAAARHTDTLESPALAQILAERLTEQGLAAVLLPQPEHRARMTIMEKAGLFLQRTQTFLAGDHTERARVISVWQRGSGGDVPVIEETRTLYDARNRLTPESAALLGPFYLFC